MNALNKLNKLILAGVCFFAIGCFYDSQEALYNNVNKVVVCDTTNITYSGKVSKIINANCSSCHSTANAPLLGSNVILDNHDDLQLWASLGNLMGDINGAPKFNQMPKTGNRLSDCDIAAIQHWIDMSTPNN
jgi:cytochrome c5